MARDPLVSKVARIVLGAVLCLIGLVGLFVPVMPGWLFILPGLALLSRDFTWAERLDSALRDRVRRARRMADPPPDPVAEADAA
ncbi:MAG: PGPGW domain-containing protein [Acidimicrobiia bacterium]|nr:PGPGW domain-containing protein [Acidimicrobiia bacterium]MDH5292700.1 PGPGW domain-containing protein [Acidimicrobiia bacterium]